MHGIVFSRIVSGPVECFSAPASAKTSVRTNARSKTVATNQSARASTSNARQAPASGQRPKVRALGVRTNAGCPWMPEKHVVERQDKSQMSVRMDARSRSQPRPRETA